MAKTGSNYFLLEGTTGSLTISADDELARKLAMLIEGKCLGLGPSKAAENVAIPNNASFSCSMHLNNMAAWH